MTNRAPAVAIVTATRNRPHLLKQALLSIKGQSFQDFESIVVDDGSTPDVQDEYREMWKELDERFTLHAASPAGGPGSDPGRGRNVGIRLAQAPLVAFLDHDDFWEDVEHLRIGVRAFDDGGADYYFTHVRFEPEHPVLMWVAPPALLSTGRQVLSDPSVYDVPLASFVKAMRHHHVHPSHSVVRRDVLERVGGFIEGLRTADDVNLMLRVADVARSICYCPRPAVAMRLPEGKSFSLATGALNQTLAEHHAMLDLRSRCLTPEVRRCARAREGWALRQLSQQVAKKEPSEARLLAWQAFVAYPTPGALWYLHTLIYKRSRLAPQVAS